MGKHRHVSKRLSLPDIKSMDHKSRKHIEELYLITDELINRHNDMNYKYDYKLYKKYKQLKEINKNLQKKIINQHCSGCKCHNQLNENMDESISFIDSKYSTIQENKKTISSNNSNQITESSSDDESEEEQMDTNETVSKTTTDDQIIEEEGDGLSNLPLLLQNIIKNKVKQSKTDNKYLLKVGLYPKLCELLCDTSVDSLKNRSLQPIIRPFLLKHIKHFGKDYMKIFSRVQNEIRDIHQSYMLEFYIDQKKEESKANRKKERQRTSL